MVFCGTAKYPDENALNLAVANLDGELNAETGMEITNFTLTLPVEQAGASINLLQEIVGAATIPAEALPLRKSHFGGNFRSEKYW